jgi:glycosyltransferase involved in cell wall biosynthesis/peptidoglycan/xylan/chitin deacetylase (PgdA/CDA1 family)
MKILIGSDEYGVDGGGKALACFQLAELFTGDSNSVAIALLSDNAGGASGNLDRNENVVVWDGFYKDLPVASGGYDGLLQFRIRNQYLSKKLTELASAWEPDICLSFGVSQSSEIMAFVAGILNIPLVISLRGSEVNLSIGDSQKSAELRSNFASAAAIVGLSQELIFKAKYLIGKNNNPRYFVIPNHIQFNLEIRERSFPVNACVLGCGARYLNEKKGILSLFHAIRRLVLDEPDIHWELELAGEIDTDLSTIYEDALLDLGIHDHVRFLGYLSREKFKNHIRTWDIYIQASVCEAFSNSVLEAIEVGTPFLISDSGYFAEILKHDAPQHVMSAVDPFSISKSIRRLREHLLKGNSDSLRTKAISSLNQNIVMNQWRGVWSSLIKPSVSPKVINDDFVLSLVLHDIGGLAFSGINVPEDVLETFVLKVQKRGFKLCSARDYWNADKKDNLIICTFDDSYSGVAEFGLPTFTQYGFSATVFVITDQIGLTNNWNFKDPVIRKHLDMSSLKNLARAGWEIGSHGKTHQNLLRLTEVEMVEEIEGAKTLLQDNFGEIESYAYPYGSFNIIAEELVKKHHSSAFALETGGQHPFIDRYKLRRYTLREIDEILSRMEKI